MTFRGNPRLELSWNVSSSFCYLGRYQSYCGMFISVSLATDLAIDFASPARSILGRSESFIPGLHHHLLHHVVSGCGFYTYTTNCFPYCHSDLHADYLMRKKSEEVCGSKRKKWHKQGWEEIVEAENFEWVSPRTSPSNFSNLCVTWWAQGFSLSGSYVFL